EDEILDETPVGHAQSAIGPEHCDAERQLVEDVALRFSLGCERRLCCRDSGLALEPRQPGCESRREPGEKSFEWVRCGGKLRFQAVVKLVRVEDLALSNWFGG